VDQLRTYAEIIGLPLKVVLTPAEMAPACASLGSADVILVDTAGRSPRDTGRLDELRRFLAEARPHQTHLVLSGTASQTAMVEAAERFAVVRPDRVIFTKLDEAVNFGVLFNVARRLSLRLSYVTTGQEVPDHIEQGRSDRLARLVLDGAPAR
jgi:flagellar biosynthesis protein FlhF